jgi:hypothetical protein
MANTSYPITEGNESTESGYPVSEIIDSVESGYPIKERDEVLYPQGPNFEIDEPVSKNDNVVTGSGPANVPIILVDVSEMASILSKTVINNDGLFTFDLQIKLEPGHLIGIQLGDIKGTGLNESDFLYNENYFVKPLIGILFDMVVVK